MNEWDGLPGGQWDSRNGFAEVPLQSSFPTIVSSRTTLSFHFIIVSARDQCVS